MSRLSSRHLPFVFTIALATCISIFFSHSDATAETQYVSDFLVVKIRNSIDPPHRIIERIQTDEAVIVLEKKGKFYLVETEKGNRGWIDKQYLKTDPPKSLVIQDLRSELAALEQNIRNTLHPAVKPQTELIELQKENQDLYQQRDLLVKEVNTLKKQIRIPNKDSQEFVTQSDNNNSPSTPVVNIQLFLAGAAVFLAGIIVSNFAGRKKKRLSY